MNRRRMWKRSKLITILSDFFLIISGIILACLTESRAIQVMVLVILSLFGTIQMLKHAIRY